MHTNTPQIAVWHVRTFGTVARWPDDYEHVATVATHDLDLAYQLTNTIDVPWTRNTGVSVTVTPAVERRGGCRSTSMGDILVLEDRPYRCALVGWDPL